MKDLDMQFHREIRDALKSSQKKDKNLNKILTISVFILFITISSYIFLSNDNSKPYIAAVVSDINTCMLDSEHNIGCQFNWRRLRTTSLDLINSNNSTIFVNSLNVNDCIQKLDLEIQTGKTAKITTKCELNFDNKISVGYIINNNQKITHGKLVAVK